jgi:hypothetical protein
MAQFVITPLNENRAIRWEKMYGRTELPVKYPLPHLACTQRWGDVPVYYLDVTAVPTALLDRLATFEARRTGTSYQEARLAVRREWLIRADECQPARQAINIPPGRFLAARLPLFAAGALTAVAPPPTPCPLHLVDGRFTLQKNVINMGATHRC